MSQAVKRACDACHRRKVKCDGINPCRNCSSAQLGCTYNAIPQKKGPKGSRAKVISELRETQRQTSLAAKVQNRMQGIPSPHPSPTQLPQPGLVTGELAKDCLDFFFNHMYAQMPILDRQTARGQVMFMEQNRDSYCLLTALSALTMLQPGKSMPVGAVSGGDPFGLETSPLANLTSSTLLVEEVVRVRRGYDYTESPDGCVGLNTLATNFFLFAVCYGVDSHAKAWFYLREATTMILMGNMHKEETYLKWDPVEAARRRRLYWLFYIAERAYALQRQRPLTLQATINLPTINDDPSDPLVHQLGNFILQANLFKTFDDPFTTTWIRARGSLSQSQVSTWQKQLNEVVRSYTLQDPHLVDLHTNTQWLKSTAWQLTNADGSLQQLARELRSAWAINFPDGAGLADSGLIETMFEISYLLADYLAVQPPSRHPLNVGPDEHLEQIINVVSVLRNGCAQFAPLLLYRLHDILPRLANPNLTNPPEESYSQLANVDLFDGFGGGGGGGGGGGTGMAVLQMGPEPTFNREFSFVKFEEQYSMSELQSTPSDSGMTSHSPHSNSPHGGTSVPSQAAPDPVGHFLVTSPGLEFPNRLSHGHPHHHHHHIVAQQQPQQQKALPLPPPQQLPLPPPPPQQQQQQQQQPPQQPPQQQQAAHWWWR